MADLDALRAAYAAARAASDAAPWDRDLLEAATAAAYLYRAAGGELPAYERPRPRAEGAPHG